MRKYFCVMFVDSSQSVESHSLVMPEKICGSRTFSMATSRSAGLGANSMAA